MNEFTEMLSRNLKLVVFDRTGLAGAYSFTLRWNPDTADALNGEDSAAMLRSEMSGAMARQLGLSLKSRKMPVEMLVVDHAEKPAAN